MFSNQQTQEDLSRAASEAARQCIACAALSRYLATVQGHLRNLGVQTPTPVQEAAIPRVLRGENIAIQSYTGSGKVRQPPGCRAWGSHQPNCRTCHRTVVLSRCLHRCQRHFPMNAPRPGSPSHKP